MKHPCLCFSAGGIVNFNGAACKYFKILSGDFVVFDNKEASDEFISTSFYKEEADNSIKIFKRNEYTAYSLIHIETLIGSELDEPIFILDHHKKINNKEVYFWQLDSD